MQIKLDKPEDWDQRRVTQDPWPHNPLKDAERDRARLMHSAAFRRLQAKTQVLGIGESDFHRTRLTHTMEVAQIGSAIALRLQRDKEGFQDYKDFLPSQALIEAICFAHDLGHPPFGHCGEIALNYAMRHHGGFEGNGQSLRIVSVMEPHTRDEQDGTTIRHGLNLTRRVLLGIIKYPAPFSKVKPRVDPPDSGLPTKRWKPPKCFLDSESDLFDWIVKPLTGNDRAAFSSLTQQPGDDRPGKTEHKSLDASIMNLADDIAYGIHDLEDGIALGLISKDDFESKLPQTSLEWAATFDVKHEVLTARLFGPASRDGSRKEAVGSLLNALVGSVCLETVQSFDCPLLKYRANLNSDARDFLNKAIELIRSRIINSQEVQTLEFRGMRVVSDLFNAVVSDPRSLLGDTQRKQLEQRTDEHRTVCDFIAGMTDVYANRFHERLYGSRPASVFERL